MTHSVSVSPPQHIASAAVVLLGWLLARALSVERASGFAMLASLAEATPNRRALVTAVLALHPWDELADTLRDTNGSSDPGCLFRDTAKEVLGRYLGQVPGLVRALERTAGQPLDDPQDYTRLVTLLTDASKDVRPVIERSDLLTSSMIRILSVLVPAFIRAGVTDRICNEDQAHTANAALAFLQRYSSADLGAANWSWLLERYGKQYNADHWLAKSLVICGDRLPQGPLAGDDQFRPISFGPDFLKLARQWRNCLADKIVAVANETSSYYILVDRDQPVMMELEHLRLLDGAFWVLKSVNLPGNAELPDGVRAAVEAKLAAKGIGVLRRNLCLDAWECLPPIPPHDWMRDAVGPQ